MENDLKTICDTIPTSSSGSVNDQAHNILLAISGESREFQISGGNLPSLYPPTVKVGYNQVSWTPNSSNGGFGSTATTTATLQGVVVTSPFVVTSSDDGKTLTITTTRDNFDPGTATVTLQYLTPAGVLELVVNTSTLTTSDHLGWLCKSSDSYGYWGNATLTLDTTQIEFKASGRAVCVWVWDGQSLTVPTTISFQLQLNHGNQYSDGRAFSWWPATTWSNGSVGAIDNTGNVSRYDTKVPTSSQLWLLRDSDGVVLAFQQRELDYHSGPSWSREVLVTDHTTDLACSIVGQIVWSR